MPNPFKTYDYEFILVILKNNKIKLSTKDFISMFLTYYKREIVQYNSNNDYISVIVVHDGKSQSLNGCNFAINTLYQINLSNTQSYEEFVNKYNSKIMLDLRNDQICSCDTNCTTDNSKLIRLDDLYQTYQFVYEIINNKFVHININKLIQSKYYTNENHQKLHLSLTSQLINAYSEYNMVEMKYITKLTEYNEKNIKKIHIDNDIRIENKKIQLNISNIRNNIGNDKKINNDIKTQMLLKIQLNKELYDISTTWINDINCNKYLLLMKHQLQDIIKLCFEISNICP